MDVTSHLSFKEKLSLACCSKKLHNIISENTLYSKLVFNNRLNLDQAMEQNNKKNLGQQVRHRVIGSMDYDARLLLSLPTVFPHVQHLQFYNAPNAVGGTQITELEAASEVEATNWPYVEKIVDSSHIINTTMHLLGTIIFGH